jgi:predicted Zn-dependent protease
LKDGGSRTEQFFVRLLVGIVAGGVLFAVAIWGGLHLFHQWQERHLIRRAAAFLSGGDVRAASLSARRALQLNPESADAARALAEIGEKAADGTELSWRRKVFELQPGSVDDGLALVRAALRANDLALAERALHELGKNAQQTAAYHAALGRVAEIKGQREAAEQHWRRAAELAPGEKAYQVQIALLELASGDPAKRQEARAALEQTRADPAQRVAATRALIIDGGTRGDDPQRLRALAEELQSSPEATFSDRVIYLEILRQLGDPQFATYLAQLEESARTNATDASALISVLGTTKNFDEALRFAGTLPPEIATKWPVPLAVAETHARAGDWAGLQAATEKADWGSFEFLRHAFLSRAFRATGQELAADQHWGLAQKAAAGYPQALMLLVQTISTWNWQKETLDLLWALTKAPETQKDALQMLYQHYAKNSDTGGVYRVLLHTAQIAPDDLMVQNNFAQVALLLNADTERARRIAAELARKEPGNAAYVSTYAYSLYAAGDVPAAVQAMEQLTEEQLQQPPIAAYYGIILAAAGQKEKAAQYLQRSREAFLLPEEKALIAKAESTLR